MCKTCDILGPGKICKTCQRRAPQEAAQMVAEAAARQKAVEEENAKAAAAAAAKAAREESARQRAIEESVQIMRDRNGICPECKCGELPRGILLGKALGKSHYRQICQHCKDGGKSSCPCTLAESFLQAEEEELAMKQEAEAEAARRRAVAEQQRREEESGINWISWYRGKYTPQQIIDAITPLVVERSKGNVTYYENQVAPEIEKLAAARAAVEAAVAVAEEKKLLEIAAAKLIEENGFKRENSYTDPGLIYINFCDSKIYRVESACQTLLSNLREYRTDLDRAKARAARTGGDHSAAIAAIQVDIDTIVEKYPEVYDELAKLKSVWDQWTRAHREYSRSHRAWLEAVTKQQEAEAAVTKAKAEAAVPFESRLKANVRYILDVERPKVLAEYHRVRGHIGGGGSYAYYGIDYEPGAEECARMAASAPIWKVVDKIDDARKLIEKGAPIIVPAQEDAVAPVINAGAGGGPDKL